MKTEVHKNDGVILLKDVDEEGHVLAEIGFQYHQGRFSVYMNGYVVDGEKYPSLQGYYAYTISKDVMNDFLDFMQREVIKDGKSKMTENYRGEMTR